MVMLHQVLEQELMKPELLSVVIRRLQVADMPLAEKERLLKEWSTKARRTLPPWSLVSLRLPPSEVT